MCQPFEAVADRTRNVTRHKDGTGTIRFYSTPTFNAQFSALFISMQSFRQNDRYFELENIPDVDRVFQILSNIHYGKMFYIALNTEG